MYYVGHSEQYAVFNVKCIICGVPCAVCNVKCVSKGKKNIESLTAVKPTLDPPLSLTTLGFIDRVVEYGMKHIL